MIAGGEAEPVLFPLLALVLAGSLSTAALFRYPRLLVRGLEWTEAHLGPPGRVLGRLTLGFCQAARSLTHVCPSMGPWTAAWGLSALNWLLDAVCLALSFAAVHTGIPWGAVLLAFAAAKVVSSIGITPGGLGVVEGGLVAMFIAYGVAGASAGAAVLVYRALTVMAWSASAGWASCCWPWRTAGTLNYRAPRLPARQPREDQLPDRFGEVPGFVLVVSARRRPALASTSCCACLSTWCGQASDQALFFQVKDTLIIQMIKLCGCPANTRLSR